jgi:hypothetical protein
LIEELCRVIDLLEEGIERPSKHIEGSCKKA